MDKVLTFLSFSPFTVLRSGASLGRGTLDRAFVFFNPSGII